MKKVFLTFSSSDLYRSLERIKREATAMELYDAIYTWTEQDLNPLFLNSAGKHLQPGSRGFGYWAWKPQILLQLLEQLQEGDLLQYTDTGCRLNRKGRNRLLQYFTLAEEAPCGILAFQNKVPEPPLPWDGRPLPEYRDFMWTKGDLIDYFGVRHRQDILESPTIGAGIIFIRKCDASVTLIRKWLQTILDDFSLIDDTPSKAPNLPGFIEHRHDQSIFSLLCKLHGASTVSAFEYWYPPKHKMFRPDWKQLKRFPIHARRDLDYGYRANMQQKLGKMSKKLKRIFFGKPVTSTP